MHQHPQGARGRAPASGPAMDANRMRGLIEALLETYDDGVAINQVEGHDLPDREAVSACLSQLHTILFPGFISGHPVTESNLLYHIGDVVNHVHMELTRVVERALRYECKANQCDHCNVGLQAEQAVIQLLERLPAVREMVKADVRAGYAGDPAATSMDEVIISYPSIQALATQRLAHELHTLKVPLIPRMWTEVAHARTGIDIHPGATIGSGCFIDHGTGVVIGETCVIGKNVQIYQGVTLGALAPAKGQAIRGQKRHPTIEDGVIIYAGATILGGKTVIGEGAVIGGNVWLTDSVPGGTKVLIGKKDLVFLQPKGKQVLTPAKFRCPAKEICEADGTIETDGMRA